MLLTVARRVGRSLLVVLLVTMGAVALLSLAPGSAASVILGENATPDAIAALNAKLGLDRPLWSQYTHWLGNAVTGDLGTSPVTNQPVLDAIVERLPVTLQLAAMALVFALLVAVLLAVVSASWPGTPIDRAITALSSVFLSVPAFIAGPVMIYFFALQAGWFPVTGWSRVSEGLGDNLRGAILPVLAISLTEIASFHRLLRTDLVGTLREDFIGAARAKGMSPSYVMSRHALRPSSFSLVTLVGINLGRLIGGTVIVESLFSLPGLGQLVVYSITARDIITVQGIVVFIAVVYVVINMLVDLSYGWLDPRVRKAANA
ncbi:MULTISPECIES: ABC transporter permease [unclassified Parafrankia]|uniref:ABC transporter permease n=1 Tax=unclassified Parafrankia TaxID=2994368 RepID=UPI000DA536F1|nr:MULTISPECIES: ABC transporter permease [unclassified Parafrankia]TCJ31319.1 ABC transporter permease [Parafrankia sp. BMG5.11]SQD96715.1 Binding-protein-dependent transport systems inner membrane component [Parafrankia sp. Ea1.12]